MADCLRFRCDVPSFGVQEELDFSLRGNLSFDWISQVRGPNSRAPSQTQGGPRWCLGPLQPGFPLTPRPLQPRSRLSAPPLLFRRRRRRRCWS